MGKIFLVCALFCVFTCIYFVSSSAEVNIIPNFDGNIYSYDIFTSRNIESDKFNRIPHKVTQLNPNKNLSNVRFNSTGMVGIQLNNNNFGYFSTFNITDGSQTGLNVNIPAFFEQGIGAYCPKNRRFYAPIQRVFGYTVYNNIVSVDTVTGQYNISDNLPFVVYSVQGFGHPLSIDDETCDVYIIGRTYLPQYQNAHVVYKFTESNGLSFVMSLGDVNQDGECMVMASAFDSRTKTLWTLQQLYDSDLQVNLHSFNVVSKKHVMTVDNQMGLYSLNFDKHSGNLYGLIMRSTVDYHVALVQINGSNGNVKIIQDYHNSNDLIVADTTIDNSKHTLHCILNIIDSGRFEYITISLDNFEMVAHFPTLVLPYIMASTV